MVLSGFGALLQAKRHMLTLLWFKMNATSGNHDQDTREEYQIRSNQLNLFKLDNARDGCPISRAGGVNVRAIRIELEFRSVFFLRKEKTGVTGSKTSRSREENQQQT